MTCWGPPERRVVFGILGWGVGFKFLRVKEVLCQPNSKL